MGSAMMNEVIYLIVNICFALIIAPLIDGIERKVKAKVQNRRGPSIFQTWYDLVKMFRKPSGITGRPAMLYKLGPLLYFSYLSAIILLIPLLFYSPLSFIGDVILVIYLLASSRIFLMLGSISSTNPYSIIGSNREISLSIFEELAIAEILGIIILSTNSLLINNIFPAVPPLKASLILALILLGVVSYIENQRLPFELGEAEPELSGGSILEYTGKELGLFYYSHYIRRLIYISIFLDIFIPHTILIRIWLYPICLILVSMFFGIVEALMGRFRIDQALSFLKKTTLIGGVLLIAAVIGI